MSAQSGFENVSEWCLKFPINYNSLTVVYTCAFLLWHVKTSSSSTAHICIYCKSSRCLMKQGYWIQFKCDPEKLFLCYTLLLFLGLFRDNNPANLAFLLSLTFRWQEKYAVICNNDYIVWVTIYLFSASILDRNSRVNRAVPNDTNGGSVPVK